MMLTIIKTTNLVKQIYDIFDQFEIIIQLMVLSFFLFAQQTSNNKQQLYLLMQHKQSQKWKILPCEMTLKRSTTEQSNYFESLSQQLYFEDDNNSELEPCLNETNKLQIDITFSKQFLHNINDGYFWHKSWLIPEITIIISQQHYNELKKCDYRVFFELTSGYINKLYDKFYLQQITLKGNRVKQFHQHTIKLKDIKFNTTSFNQDRKKFHLIFIIYMQNEINDKFIIKAYISTEIYVDSRKYARQKIHSIVTLPTQPDKFLIQPYDSITNEIESLKFFIQFYGATNVRFKNKHPLYICYHFSNIFTLYFNNQIFNDPLSALHATLSNDFDKKNDKPLLIHFQISTNQDLVLIYKKKISTIFQNWKNPYITISSNKCIPKTSKWVIILKNNLIHLYEELWQSSINKNNIDNIMNKNKIKNNNSRSKNMKKGSFNNNEEHVGQLISKHIPEAYELHQCIDINHPQNSGTKKIKPL